MRINNVINDEKGKIYKIVNYPFFIIIVVSLALAGCGSHSFPEKKDRVEEDKENSALSSESVDETSVLKNQKAEGNDSDDDKDNTDSESASQNNKMTEEEADFSKSPEWNKYEPVDATDMILQVGDVFIRYGDTVGDVFEQFNNSEIKVSTEVDLNKRGNTDPIDVKVLTYNEAFQGNVLWLTLRAMDPTFSWTLPVSDYQIINVELSDDARDHSYLLDGRYYSEISAMSYNDVLDLKGDFFPENTFEMYEDKNEDGYYTITFVSERDKGPLLIPNTTRGNSRVQTEREYVFTIPNKSGTVLYYEEHPTRGGDMICIDPLDLSDDSLYDSDEDNVENGASTGAEKKTKENDKVYKRGQRNSEYIIPDSGERLLTISDLSGLSSDELRKARNEIVARHGRRFKDQELQDYFDSKSWYDGTIDPDDFNDYTMLNEIERKNMNFIKDHER